MNLGLESKVALITGAGRGIGRAEAMALVAEGVKIAINDVNAEMAQKTAEEIVALGGKAHAFPGDVSDEKSVIAIVEQACDQLGTIDILINNAGAGAKYWGQPVDALPVESWDAIINSHLRSTFLVSKYVSRIMKRQQFGRIVNTSSMNAIGGGPPGASNYTAAKAAIIGLTRNMAKEIGLYGVTVNAIAPGYVHTDLVASYPEERMRIMVSQNPVGRLCSLEEVAALVAFLCSRQAAFINGAIFSMDGGRQDFYWGTQTF
jgi:3-oxoacyl-[acyl-carrier protein] reductase